MKKAISLLLILMLLSSLAPMTLASEEAAEAPAPTAEVPAEEAEAPAAAAPAADGAPSSGQCGDNVFWRYQDRVLTIYGEGAMYDYDNYYFCHLFYYDPEPETIVIEAGVTHIGKRAFAQNMSLKNLQIASTVKTIGELAFYFCPKLAVVVIPEGVTRIESQAFDGCGMEYVSIPLSVEYIGYNALHHYDQPDPNAVTPVYYSGTVEEWNKIYHSLPAYVDLHCGVINSIESVDIASLTKPRTGRNITQAGVELAAGSHCTILKQYWTKEGGGDEYTGKVRANRTYDLFIALLPEDGYTFGPAGTMIPVTLQGETFVTAQVYDDIFGHDGVLLIMWDYTTPPMYVSGVALTVTAPKAGAPVVADGERAGDDSRYVIVEQGWYYSDSLFTEVDGTFHDGGTYYYTALLETRQDDYRFIPPDDGQPGYMDPAEFGATVNGLLVSSVYWENDTIRIIIPFTVGDVYSGAASLTGPSKPGIGREIKANGKTSSSDYYIESQGWFEDLTGVTPVTDSTFEAGKNYIWICTLRAGGKVFQDSYKGPVTLDGAAVPKASLGDVLANVLAGKNFTYYAASDGVLIVRAYYFMGVLGDVDCDGEVTPADAAQALKAPALCRLSVSDVDGSGKVDDLDAALILQYCAGTVTEFPVP